MQDNDKLIGLIEQVACGVNMLNPTDLSEVENLQKILDQLSEAIAEISDGPAELLQQAKDATSGSTKLLEEILKQQVEDTKSSIEAVSQTVSTLQALIDQITQDSAAVDSAAAKIDTFEDVETAPQERVSEEDASLVLDFITESGEHIESAEAGLLELESKPDDSEVLNQIFRAFHTIKGMAGFLNLPDIGSLAHSAENLLDIARKGQLLMVGENTDVIFESIDMLKKMIAALKKSVEAGKPVPAQKHLPQLLAKLKAAAEDQTLAASLGTTTRPRKGQRTG